MNERVRELRTALGLSAEKFGSRVGVTRSAISRIENGIVNVTDQMMLSICREFDVNEEWLRNGTGEMFMERKPQEPFCDMVNILASLDADDWQLLVHAARVLYNKKNRRVESE